MDTKTKHLIQQHYSINQIVHEDINSMKFYPYINSNTWLVALASTVSAKVEVYDHKGICINVLKI